jgi:7-carboxy-7-deazaguanine synthase
MLGITEIFLSIQGEGTHTGTSAIFVRLSGCNLTCSFCDTDFALREMLSITDILSRIEQLDKAGAIIILTGGEPLAQQETLALIDALLAQGRRVHIESNGTIPVNLPDAVWLTVSPKERVHPKMKARANELKLIVDGRVPLEWLDDEPLDAKRTTYLQPENNKQSNIQLAIEAIQRDPKRLRLSLQTHKFIGIA